MAQQQTPSVSNAAQAKPITIGFGVPSLNMPDTPGVYNNRDGRSVGIISISVPLTLGALTIATLRSTFYMDAKNDGTLGGKVGLPAAKTFAFSSPELKTLFGEHVKRHVEASPLYPRAWEAGIQALAGPVKGKNGKTSNPFLVAPPKTAQSTPEPADTVGPVAAQDAPPKA